MSIRRAIGAEFKSSLIRSGRLVADYTYVASAAVTMAGTAILIHVVGPTGLDLVALDVVQGLGLITFAGSAAIATRRDLMILHIRSRRRIQQERNRNRDNSP